MRAQPAFGTGVRPPFPRIMALFNVVVALATFAALMARSGLQLFGASPAAEPPAAPVLPTSNRGGGHRSFGGSLVPRNNEAREDAQASTPALHHQLAAGGMAAAAYLGTALGVGGAEVVGLVAATGLVSDQGLPLLQKLLIKPARKLLSTKPRSHAKVHSAAAPLVEGSARGLRNTLEHMPAPSLDTAILAWEVLSYFRRFFFSPEQPEEHAQMPTAGAAFPESVFNLSMPAAIVCAAIIVAASFGIGIGLGVGVIVAARGVTTSATCSPQPSYSTSDPLSSLQYIPKDRRYPDEALTPRTVSTSAPSSMKVPHLGGHMKVQGLGRHPSSVSSEHGEACTDAVHVPSGPPKA